MSAADLDGEMGLLYWIGDLRQHVFVGRAREDELVLVVDQAHLAGQG